jgi:hypothetical protein
MSVSRCDRFEETTRTEDPRVWEDLEAHAVGCLACRQRLALWRQTLEAAPTLRKEWDSPDLFPRIAKAIAEGSPAQAPAPAAASGRWRFLPAAAVAALVVLSMVGVRVFRGSGGREPLSGRFAARAPLMTEQALSEVEGAETVYLSSIEKLSRVVRPRLEDPKSPLAATYREKLLLLDSAIAEMRGEIERNQFNTHLRRELLAMYREKQRTLEDLMKVGQS